MKVDEWAAFDEQSCNIGRHHWNVAKLITKAARLPVKEVPIDALCVAYSYKNLRLRDFVMHMRAVLSADLDYPIILDEDGELMDGRHRLMRAIHEGRETINVVRFEKNPPPDKIDE